MPNLMDAVTTHKELTPGAHKRIRVCLMKHDLGLSASAEQSRKSERFYLVKLPVRKLPLLSAEAERETGAIIIDVNHKRRKANNTGFVPKIMLLKGARTLQAAKASDKMFCTAWIGERALRKLHISAEDAVGANELQTKLQRLVSEKYKNQKSSKASTGDCSYSPSPWVSEIYPFDNYFVFNYDGDTYSQAYTLNKNTREPTLEGEAAKVFVKYVPESVAASSLADMLYNQSFVDKTMTQESMFDKVNNSSPALGAIAYSSNIVPDGTYYPSGSELARPELRTMLNVKEALAIFLSVLKDGMHGPLQQMFSPVMVPTDKFLMNACQEAEIAAKVAHRKINVLDFVNWQHATLTKKGTQSKYNLTASAYAYVGDPTDISTWHLRCETEGTIRDSLKKVMGCDGVPDRKKVAIQGKLKAMLKKSTGR